MSQNGIIFFLNILSTKKRMKVGLYSRRSKNYTIYGIEISGLQMALRKKTEN